MYSNYIYIKCFSCGSEHRLNITQSKVSHDCREHGEELQCKDCGEHILRLVCEHKKSKMPELDERIIKNLQISSKTCYENGAEMLDDANLLFDNKRYSRSLSVAILAEEEITKSVFLQILIAQRRWDSEVYSLLVSHKHKHTFAQSLKEIVSLMVNHLNTSSRMLVPVPLNLEKRASEIVKSNRKKLLKKGNKDKLKQHAQFVELNINGQVVSDPSFVNMLKAAEVLDDVLRFKVMAGCLLGEFEDSHPLLRTSSYLEYEKHLTTLVHESGVTIKMCIFDLELEKYGNDRLILNPFTTLSELGSLSFDQLFEEERKIVSRLCKAYKFSSQIKLEMDKLGLRSPVFLNQCLELEGHQ